MKLLTLFITLFCIQLIYSQNLNVETKKQNLADRIWALDDFGLPLEISPKSSTYELYGNYNSNNFKLVHSSYDNKNSPIGLIVFDIRKSNDNSDLLFRVIDHNGNVGWVKDSMFNYSDLHLGFAIGLLNDKESYSVNKFISEEFQSLYGISENNLLTLNNSLVNDENKNKYALQIEKEKIGDSIHIHKMQKLFFGYNCDAPINEIIIDNNKATINEKEFVIKQSNLFKILIKKDGDIYVQENGNIEKIELKELSRKLVNFLDNGSGIGEDKCDYCQGRKHPASSSSPLKATIAIHNKFDFRRDYITYNVYKEIRSAYDILWKSIAERNGITEFDKIKCEIRHKYQNKYPVNIIYLHRDYKGGLHIPSPSEPPLSKPVTVETIINPEEVNQKTKTDNVVIEVPFAVVESVPVFSGCENGTNATKKTCMDNSIITFINAEFNKEIKTELGLSGLHNISILFKINVNGEIIDVKARAPHPNLEKEAKRVIKLLPKMTPGNQYGKNVIVIYNLKFKV